jgi:hypothetical protein
VRYRRGWIVLLLLALLTPLGIIAAGGSWGEWGPRDVKNRVGYVPRGMSESAAKRTDKPFDGYEMPGLHRSGAGKNVGYVIAAIVGAGLTGGTVLILGKGITRGGVS